jgi:hypothetical protein
MMDAEERHWTEDSELIERFVLNKLDPDERNELEDHLRVCEVCKQAVRAEQVLIAGIRRAGRERFKAELAEKLTAAEKTRIPWPHILSAAAVVVIVIGVALYNRWFEIIQPPETESISRISERAETEQPGEQRLEQPPSEKHQKPLPPVERKRREQQTQQSPRAEQRAEAVTSEAMRGKYSIAGGSAAHVQKVETEQAHPHPETRLVAPQEELWLEGQIIDFAGEMMNAPAEQPAQLFKAEQQDAQQPQSAERKHEFWGAPFVLRLHVLDSLPPHRKEPKQSPTVPASIHRSDDTTYVTVYLDTPAAFDRVAIAMPAPDSLIVTLTDRRILYRLPEGWEAKPRRTK